MARQSHNVQNGWAQLVAPVASPAAVSPAPRPATVDIGPALRELLAYVNGERDELSDATREWFSTGGAAVLLGQVRSLDQALGLKPARGGRWLRERERDAKRLRVISLLAVNLSGTSWQKAQAASRIIRGEEPAPTEEIQRELESAAADGINLARSPRRLLTLIVRCTAAA